MFLKPGRPLSWTHGNLVFARSLRDVWAVYKLPTVSYGGAPRSKKEQLFWNIYDFACGVEADFSLLRVQSWWDPDSYARSMRAQALSASPHRALRDAYIQAQVHELEQLGGTRIPQVYLSIALKPASTSMGEIVSDLLVDGPGMVRRGRDHWASRRREFGLGGAWISYEQLEAHHVAAAGALERLVRYVPDATPVTDPEMEWLVSRAETRGLGEPEIDGIDAPQALVIEHNGRVMLRPMSVDLLRWQDYKEHTGLEVRIPGEEGTSWQSGLALKRMPRGGREDGDFPSDALEILFRPVEQLDFPVDLSVTCKWISNAQALEKIERTITRADASANAQAESERGLSAEALERVERSHQLKENYKQLGVPALHSQITAITAVGDFEDVDPDGAREQLREQRRAIKDKFKQFDTVIKTPVSQQLQIFAQHLPGQRAWVRGYGRFLTPENLGATAPLATHSFGHARGWIFGRTISATPAPVRLDIREGSRTNRKTAIAVLGEMGSGKTTTLQKIMREAVLDDGRVVDGDYKNDHHLWEEPELADHVERITLKPAPELRGLLDPWLIARAEVAQAAAHDNLTALLPKRAPATWDSALVRALHAVATRAKRPTNLEVVRALHDSGEEVDQLVFRHLEGQAHSGLGQLLFADPDGRRATLGRKQVTHIVTKGLPLPSARTARADYTPAELIGNAIQGNLSLLAHALLDEHPDVLKVYNDDEGWRRLSTEHGRESFEELQRLGRSELVVPMVGTQLPSDLPPGVGDLFGLILVFRIESEPEREAALRVIGLDPEDEHNEPLLERLGTLSEGQCLAKNHTGQQIEFVQVDLIRSLLARYTTNPMERSAAAMH